MLYNRGMLDPKLLNLLACPDCKLDLVYRRQGETEDLLCPKCQRQFPIKDGIPHLLPNDVLEQ